MTSSFNVFGTKTASAPRANLYLKLGFSMNPFRPAQVDVRTGNVPFYEDYVSSQLAEINQWAEDVHLREQRHPLALVGNIGVGKTLVIGRLVHGLRDLVAQRIAVDSLILSDAGYGRISVGAWLVMALERLDLPWLATSTPLPPDILPVLYHLAFGQTRSSGGSGRVGRALAHITGRPQNERATLIRHLTTWLKRGALTDAQSRTLGLGRRLDWEGELIPVVGEILTLAKDAGILGTFFLFIDQLEDLFSKGLTPVRQSRVLTDLRGLIDIIDSGAPMGLLLSWAPSLDSVIRTQYAAVYTRLRRRRVELPLMEAKDAEGFARAWILGQKDKPGYEPQKHPRVPDLTQAAWLSLRSEGKLFSPGEKATPRDFLTALARELDRRAGVTA